jgi:type II protein arginine methyltransferase
MIDRAITELNAGIEGHPHYARNLVAIAEAVLLRKERLRAFDLARKALREAGGDAEAETRARALLGSLLPPYHVPMMNDARRNEAWDQALRRAIRPGMRVLEIGTGAGMLALMAARAGAEKVTTCERDPVAAAVAREICENNGYGGVVDVVAKRSQDLIPGVDLERPADLLFCDIFSDSLIGFDPLPALVDARHRLLAPGAPVVPAAGAIGLALARWSRCDVVCRATSAAGFDIGAIADLARTATVVAIGSPDVVLRSTDAEAFRFDFAAPSHPEEGSRELVLEADRDGTVDGVVQWIRLELDSETSLSSRPEPGASFFSAPVFRPFPESVEARRGDRIGVSAWYLGNRLFVRRS